MARGLGAGEGHSLSIEGEARSPREGLEETLSPLRELFAVIRGGRASFLEGSSPERGRLDKEDNASLRQKASVRGIGEAGDREETRSPMPFLWARSFKTIFI